MVCVQKERKLLQVKRLDLDAAKTRLKKARMTDARAAVSTHTLSAILLIPGWFVFLLKLINDRCWWTAFSKIITGNKAAWACSLSSHKSWLTQKVTQHETDYFISCDLNTVTWTTMGSLDFPYFLSSCSKSPFLACFFWPSSTSFRFKLCKMVKCMYPSVVWKVMILHWSVSNDDSRVFTCWAKTLWWICGECGTRLECQQ